METFFGNIFGVLLVIAIPIGFILFMQLMSKISGKRIVQKYSNSTLARPTDFDESVDTIKKASEDLSFAIKKLKLDNVEQVVYKLDKVLAKAPSIPFRDYYENKVRYENLINEISKRERLSINDLNSVPIYDRKLEEKLRQYKIRYEVDLMSFNQKDLEKIQSFMFPVLDNDFNQLIEFLDHLGRPNFREFASVIDMMEKMYLSSKITKEEIFNIKLLILKRKGMLRTII
jgi:hypothetical protein